jgi:hypothetical protein
MTSNIIVFICWSLFIISFFFTIFVIIMNTVVLEKDRDKKGKHFIIALITSNIAIFGFCLLAIFSPLGNGGLGFFALYFLFTIFVLIPLAIIDIISILISLRKQQTHGIPKNENYFFYTVYAILAFSVILIIFIAWPVLQYYFHLMLRNR